MKIGQIPNTDPQIFSLQQQNVKLTKELSKLRHRSAKFQESQEMQHENELYKQELLRMRSLLEKTMKDSRP